jgi:hypothetical protein
VSRAILAGLLGDRARIEARLGSSASQSSRRNSLVRWVSWTTRTAPSASRSSSP